MHSDICQDVANFSDAEGVTLYVTVGSIANNGDEEDVVYNGDGKCCKKDNDDGVANIEKSVANNANEDDRDIIGNGDVGVAYHDSGEKSSRKRYKQRS